MREALANQRRADVPPAHQERAAQSPIIAFSGAFLSWPGSGDPGRDVGRTDDVRADRRHEGVKPLRPTRV
jgi:hypothetical protein